ncbi:hypothetical protein [Neobacillus vireti]|uniref:hypothetical protein n=1 Tax=Neobacillus vireti TaxID=220686 RepID=UPI002FFE427D
MLTPEDFKKAAQNGIASDVLSSRVVKYGWDKEKAINTPIREYSTYEDKSLYWNYVNVAVVGRRTFDYRIKKGWSPYQAATIPPTTGPRKATFDLITS